LSAGRQASDRIIIRTMRKQIESTIVVGGLVVLVVWLFAILPLVFYSY
jgi:hypothetical protein